MEQSLGTLKKKKYLNNGGAVEEEEFIGLLVSHADVGDMIKYVVYSLRINSFEHLYQSTTYRVCLFVCFV